MKEKVLIEVSRRHNSRERMEQLNDHFHESPIEMVIAIAEIVANEILANERKSMKCPDSDKSQEEE